MRFIFVLDLGDDPLEVDVEPAAGRAGDDLGLGHPPVAGAEDVEAGGDLGDRVAQERDADRVADAPQEDRADARGALERAVLPRAGLGDADVGRDSRSARRTGCSTRRPSARGWPSG